MKTKRICEDCLKSIVRFHRHETRILCNRCYMKKMHIIGAGGRPTKTLQEALDKVYEVRGYLNKQCNYIQATCSFPSAMIGRKFKVVLEETD